MSSTNPTASPGKLVILDLKKKKANNRKKVVKLVWQDLFSINPCWLALIISPFLILYSLHSISAIPLFCLGSMSGWQTCNYPRRPVSHFKILGQPRFFSQGPGNSHVLCTIPKLNGSGPGCASAKTPGRCLSSLEDHKPPIPGISHQLISRAHFFALHGCPPSRRSADLRADSFCLLCTHWPSPSAIS